MALVYKQEVFIAHTHGSILRMKMKYCISESNYLLIQYTFLKWSQAIFWALGIEQWTNETKIQENKYNIYMLDSGKEGSVIGHVGTG